MAPAVGDLGHVTLSTPSGSGRRGAVRTGAAVVREADGWALCFRSCIHGRLRAGEPLGEGAPLDVFEPEGMRSVIVPAELIEEWSQRRLEGREVAVWADGIYVKAGLERDKAALLVVPRCETGRRRC